MLMDTGTLFGVLPSTVAKALSAVSSSYHYAVREDASGVRLGRPSSTDPADGPKVRQGQGQGQGRDAGARGRGSGCLLWNQWESASAQTSGESRCSPLVRASAGTGRKLFALSIGSRMLLASRGGSALTACGTLSPRLRWIVVGSFMPCKTAWAIQIQERAAVTTARCNLAKSAKITSPGFWREVPRLAQGCLHQHTSRGSSGVYRQSVAFGT